MRHMKNSVKLGRSAEARKALLSSLVSNFIQEQRIQTTIQKAKQTRMLAEKVVTTAKKALASGKPEDLLSAKRKILSVLRHRKHVDRLFEAIAPQYKDRQGGYTRIVRIGQRGGDASEMVVLEWVDLAAVDKRRKAKADESPATEEKGADEKKEG
jgi:large subunit ribosomal protein L17